MAGPWRPLIVKYYQNFHKNKTMDVNEIPFFSVLDVDNVVHNVDKYGYSMGINLSEKYVDAVAKCYEDNKARITWDPHKTNKIIFDIAHNCKIVEVARKYIGAEPIFHSSVMIRTTPLDSIGISSPPGHQHFHYDAGDFKSLTLFIYLTDTDRYCGPHVVIENTHKCKNLLQLINRRLTNNEAHEKYGDRVKVIIGKKGTGFFEDFLSFHKQLIDKKSRLILSLLYVLRRNPRL